MPSRGLCIRQKENCEEEGMTLERVARPGLFEEGTYLGLKIPVWRGFTHWVGLDWKLLKAPVSCEGGRDWLYFLTTMCGRRDHHF